MKVREIKRPSDIEKGVDSAFLTLQEDYNRPTKITYVPASPPIDTWGTYALTDPYAYAPTSLFTDEEREKLRAFLNISLPYTSMPNRWSRDAVHFSTYHRDPQNRRVIQVWGLSKDFSSLPTNKKKPKVNPYDLCLAVGFDPEVFVRDKHNNLVPAFQFLSTEKEEIEKFDEFSDSPPSSYRRGSRKARSPYWDGFAAEFQTDPYHCFAYAVDQIAYQLDSLKHRLPRGAKIVLDDFVEVPNVAAYSDEQTKLGCDPSLNAYGAPTPNLDPYMPFRTAGFHIHFGHPILQMKSPTALAELVRLFDYYIAIPNMLILEGLESTKRRQYYGLPGEFRIPPHGLEYRALSSTTLASPVFVHLAIETGRALIGAAISGYLSTYKRGLPPSQSIFDTLQNYDYETARSWLPQLRRKLSTLLTTFTFLRRDVDTALDLLALKAKDLPTLEVSSAWHLGSWSTHCGNLNTSLTTCTLTEKAKTATL